MSETQNEYETDAEPTPGPVTKGVTSNPERRIAKVLKGTDMVGEHNTHCDIHSKRHPIQGQEPVANADLIVTAFNAAQEVKEMGYDPVAVQKALPKILSAAEELLGRVEDDCRARNINPYDEPSFTALEYALASAEGSEE